MINIVNSGPFAGFDLGTGGIRYNIGEVEKNGDVNSLHRSSFSHGMGNDIVATGSITQSTIDNVLKWLDDAHEKMDEYGCKNHRFIATEILRSAQNGDDVIAQIESHHGFKVDIIDHDAEIYLSALGNLKWLKDSEQTVYVDFGGGSTELAIVANDATVIAEQGTKIGASRGIPFFEDVEKPEWSEVRTRMDEMVSEFSAIFDSWSLKSGTPFVLSGCPYSAMSHMKGVDAKNLKKHAGRLTTKKEIHDVFMELYNLGRSGRANHHIMTMPNDVMRAPATMIVQAFVEASGAEEFRICSTGVDSGLIISQAMKG